MKCERDMSCHTYLGHCPRLNFVENVAEDNPTTQPNPEVFFRWLSWQIFPSNNSNHLSQPTSRFIPSQSCNTIRDKMLSDTAIILPWKLEKKSFRFSIVHAVTNDMSFHHSRNTQKNTIFKTKQKKCFL